MLAFNWLVQNSPPGAPNQSPAAMSTIGRTLDVSSNARSDIRKIQRSAPMMRSFRTAMDQAVEPRNILSSVALLFEKRA